MVAQAEAKGSSQRVVARGQWPEARNQDPGASAPVCVYKPGAVFPWRPPSNSYCVFFLTSEVRRFKSDPHVGPMKRFPLMNVLTHTTSVDGLIAVLVVICMRR
jgi:hypothetical protein